MRAPLPRPRSRSRMLIDRMVLGDTPFSLRRAAGGSTELSVKVAPRKTDGSRLISPLSFRTPPHFVRGVETPPPAPRSERRATATWPMVVLLVLSVAINYID